MPKKWNSTGENNTHAKLTTSNVAQIKRRLLDIQARRAGGGTPVDSVAQIAEDYGVSEPTIYAIKNKTTWRDVEPAK